MLQSSVTGGEMDHPTEEEIYESINRAQRFLAAKPDWLIRLWGKIFSGESTRKDD